MVSTILTQFHVSKGLKVYGEKGVNTVLQKLQQLHNCLVIEPKFSEKMTERYIAVFDVLKRETWRYD